MAEYDLHSYVSTEVAILMLDQTATDVDGPDIDTSGFESVDFVVYTGVLTAGTGKYVIEESDDDGAGSPAAYAVVDVDDLVGLKDPALNQILMAAAGDDNAVARVGYIGKKKFVRMTQNELVTFAGFEAGAIVILGNPVSVPTADQVAA